MSDDTLRAEFEKWIHPNDRVIFTRDAVASMREAYLAAAEPREKRIAELEQRCERYAELLRNDTRAAVVAYKKRIEELESQLPDSMKHCTILFKECARGHGRLTATNWVPHGCQTCEIGDLKTSLARMTEALRAIEQWQGVQLPVFNDEFLRINDLREYVRVALAIVKETP